MFYKVYVTPVYTTGAADKKVKGLAQGCIAHLSEARIEGSNS